MAILDSERAQVVVRIAYDGAALAGKTTSVKALSRSLGRDVFSGGEVEGRTLFFDWMDYAGGSFEGYEIRCQVVSVPGQRVLRRRRHELLRTADAVVFVADGTPGGLPESLEAFRSLRETMADQPTPHAGVIVQANKRDRPDRIALDELRRRFGGDGVALIESVATDGTGVRETFIFAVRLALDRVRELLQEKRLDRGRPRVDSGAALLAELSAQESLAPPVLPPQNAIPSPPDDSVPGGMIWPPVEGRVILHNAAPFSLYRNTAGDWTANADGRWLLHSAHDDVFTDLERGRDMLLRWAGAHAAASRFLSPHRCIVLAESEPGQWRLWQVVRQSPSLLRVLAANVSNARSVAEIANLLLDAASAVAEAAATMDRRWFAASASIAASIASTPLGVTFAGLMPSLSRLASAEGREPAALRLLIRSELHDVLRHVLATRNDDIPALIDALMRSRARLELREALAATLLDT